MKLRAMTSEELQALEDELRGGKPGLCWIVVHPNGDLVLNRPVLDERGVSMDVMLWRVTREQARAAIEAGATYQGPPDKHP